MCILALKENLTIMKINKDSYESPINWEYAQEMIGSTNSNKLYDYEPNTFFVTDFKFDKDDGFNIIVTKLSDKYKWGLKEKFFPHPEKGILTYVSSKIVTFL